MCVGGGGLCCRCLQNVVGTFAYAFHSSTDSCSCYTEDSEKLHCLVKSDVRDEAHHYFYIKQGLSNALCEYLYYKLIHEMVVMISFFFLLFIVIFLMSLCSAFCKYL